MVQDLATAIRESWTPDQESFEVEDEPEVVAPAVREYVAKATMPSKALVASDFKYHIMDTVINESHTLCGRLKLSDVVSFGPDAPGMICHHCQTKLKSLQ